MATKTITRALCALFAYVALATTAQAQAPTAYKPGDTLTFTVKFEGDGVDRLTGAQVTLDLTSHPQDDQKAFLTSLNANRTPAGGRAGVFDVSIKIPDFIASGTYMLRRVSTGTPYVGFSYSEDLPAITITVENHEHFTEPKLKSVEKTSNP